VRVLIETLIVRRVIRLFMELTTHINGLVNERMSLKGMETYKAIEGRIVDAQDH
jgi:hypothetical protein